MSLWGRGKWAWADFTVNDTRYRLPLKDQRGNRIPYTNDPASKDYQKALKAEGAAIEKAKKGELAQARQSFARLPFGEAADRYLREREPYLAPLSIRTEKERAKPLRNFFGAMRLSRIDLDAIRDYISERRTSGV